MEASSAALGIPMEFTPSLPTAGPSSLGFPTFRAQFCIPGPDAGRQQHLVCTVAPRGVTRVLSLGEQCPEELQGSGGAVGFPRSFMLGLTCHEQ